MRTNIVLDDVLIQEAMKYSQARTRRALIEEALKTFIQAKAAERRRGGYQERVEGLQRRLADVVLRESPHRVLRSDRERS
jgi:Arc/MetJ family transcription regulator